MTRRYKRCTNRSQRISRGITTFAKWWFTLTNGHQHNCSRLWPGYLLIYQWTNMHGFQADGRVNPVIKGDLRRARGWANWTGRSFETIALITCQDPFLFFFLSFLFLRTRKQWVRWKYTYLLFHMPVSSLVARNFGIAPLRHCCLRSNNKETGEKSVPRCYRTMQNINANRYHLRTFLGNEVS